MNKSSLMLSGALALTVMASVVVTGCGGDRTRGAVVGGAVVGGAYEYQNKQALDKLEKDYEQGKISYDEYKRRKKEITKRSLIY
jgi:hypothetical protein